MRKFLLLALVGSFASLAVTANADTLIRNSFSQPSDLDGHMVFAMTSVGTPDRAAGARVVLPTGGKLTRINVGLASMGPCEMDLRPRNIVLSAGQEYWVGLLPITTSGGGLIFGGLVDLGGGGSPTEPWLAGIGSGYDTPSPFHEIDWVDPEGFTYIGMRDAAALKITSMPHTKPQVHHTPWAARLLPCIPGVSC